MKYCQCNECVSMGCKNKVYSFMSCHVNSFMRFLSEVENNMTDSMKLTKCNG